jgi:hypothetical protein
MPYGGWIRHAHRLLPGRVHSGLRNRRRLRLHYVGTLHSQDMDGEVIVK